MSHLAVSSSTAVINPSDSNDLSNASSKGLGFTRARDMAAGGNGPSSPAANGAGGRRRPLPHIDDITNVTVEMDEHTPIDKIILVAETAWRTAQSSKNFGRPDIALKESIRTHIILLTIVKESKDWSSLEDKQTLHARYQQLVRQTKAAQGEYEQIKMDIMADNARTGVQPMITKKPLNGASSTRPDTPSSTSHTEHVQSGHDQLKAGPASPASSTTLRATSPLRAKPPIHPKPNALHGKALKPPADLGQPKPPRASAVNDLAARFANLRSSTASTAAPADNSSPVNLVQDPRIRTQPIVAPAVPSPFPPSSQRPSVSLSTEEAAALPKVPDAIYSPARGTVSREAAELPSSTPRGIFTRTSSTASFSGLAAKTAKSPPLASQDCSVPAYSFGTNSAPIANGRPKVQIPKGLSISPQTLVDLMSHGANDIKILLIDIRTREEYDQGHIFSQATICLESDILQRPHIGADEIVDSMILAPAHELRTFEKRHEFDLAVFYDQNSPDLTLKADTDEEKAATGLWYALEHFDFSVASKDHKLPVRMLKGGLDAWTALMGPGNIRTSNTACAKSMPSKTFWNQPFQIRRKTYMTKPIQDPEEAKRWESTLDDMEDISPIVKTTEEVLRRFPTVSTIQESMVSPSFHDRLSQEEQHLSSSVLHPPTYPPPAVPRRSYTGLADNDHGTAAIKAMQITDPGNAWVTRPGLKNPHNWCYGNSSLQAMFSTPGFSRDLWSNEWTNQYQVPRKEGEVMNNPQLLTKMVANLFHFLNLGQHQVLEAKTLMTYVNFIHRSSIRGQVNERSLFGSQYQQDAYEYYNFITATMHDETNVRRDQALPKSNGYSNSSKSLAEIAVDYWASHSHASASIIDRYFRGLQSYESRCTTSQCGWQFVAIEPADVWVLNFHARLDDQAGAVLLTELMDGDIEPEIPQGVRCEKCNKTETRWRRMAWARLPDRLAICLSRFTDRASKRMTTVRFPIRGLNLTKYSNAREGNTPPELLEGTLGENDAAHYYLGPMMYDCYAVTMHSGGTANSGHYFSYVRNERSADPRDWYHCNDTTVTPIKVDVPKWESANHRIFKDDNSNATAYMLYYERRGHSGRQR